MTVNLIRCHRRDPGMEAAQNAKTLAIPTGLKTLRFRTRDRFSYLHDFLETTRLSCTWSRDQDPAKCTLRQWVELSFEHTETRIGKKGARIMSPPNLKVRAAWRRTEKVLLRKMTVI
jgi:hypothetical protein